MVDDVDHARDLLWDSLLSALRATRLHADPFHIPYPGAGGGPAPSVSTGFRSAIESPSAGRTWWQFWWQYVGALAGIPGHAHRKQVPEIPETAHLLLPLPNRFPSWTSPVRPRSPALSEAPVRSGASVVLTSSFFSSSYAAEALVPVLVPVVSSAEPPPGTQVGDTRRRAAIGYCYGGSNVLDLARAGADVQAVVSVHGMLRTPAPARKGDIVMPSRPRWMQPARGGTSSSSAAWFTPTLARTPIPCPSRNMTRPPPVTATHRARVHRGRVRGTVVISVTGSNPRGRPRGL
jgi:hypothetical protein